MNKFNVTAPSLTIMALTLEKSNDKVIQIWKVSKPGRGYMIIEKI